MPASTAAEVARPGGRRRRAGCSISAPTSPSIEPTRSSSAAADLRDGGDVRAGLLERLLARPVARRGRRRRGPARASSLRVALDLGGGRLGGLEDRSAPGVPAGRRERRRRRLPLRGRALQLLELARPAPAGARRRRRGRSRGAPIGKSRRSIACRSRSTARHPRRMSPAGVSAGRLPRARWAVCGSDLLQVAAQLAQLVAQLRGVLEAQLLGRREHLLLELDDQPLELVRRQLLGRAALARRGVCAARGTFDSACRNSAMSEMPLTIVAAVMPCSSL